MDFFLGFAVGIGVWITSRIVNRKENRNLFLLRRAMGHTPNHYVPSGVIYRRGGRCYVCGVANGKEHDKYCTALE